MRRGARRKAPWRRRSSPWFRTGVVAAAIVGAVAVVHPGETHAAPRLQLERCIGLNRFELGRAVERELAASPAAETAEGLVITASCADGVSATIRVSAIGVSQVAERTLALGEVPAELRPRLLALVVVELVESWAASPPSPPAAPVLLVTSAAAAAPAGSTEELRAVEPEPLGQAGVVKAAAGATQRRSSARERRALIDVGVGTRYYVETPAPLLQGSLETELPWFAAGAVAAVGSAVTPTGIVLNEDGRFVEAEVGRFKPYLVALSLRRTIDCLDGGRGALCVGLRVESGLSALAASNRYRGDYDLANEGPDWFAQGAAIAEGRLAMAALECALRFELGWSKGVVYRAPNSKVASFDGISTAVNIAFRWTR